MLVAENDFTGDLDDDSDNPFSTIAYTSSRTALGGPPGQSGIGTCAEGTDWTSTASLESGSATFRSGASRTGMRWSAGPGSSQRCRELGHPVRSTRPIRPFDSQSGNDVPLRRVNRPGTAIVSEGPDFPELRAP